MKLYAVTIEISEAATDYEFPVVSHTFLGRSRKEAWHYHDSHLKTDEFLRSCEKKGKFSDVKCRAEVTFEGWVNRPKPYR